MTDQIEQIAKEIAAEVRRADGIHPPMHSPHEGWSVLYEEVEELREHVRADTGQSEEARKEAIQVAAMGLKYVHNLCKTPEPQKEELPDMHREFYLFLDELSYDVARTIRLRPNDKQKFYELFVRANS